MRTYDQQAHGACLAFVRLRAMLVTLPLTDPTRPFLADAVAQADRTWRTLAATAAAASTPLSDDPEATSFGQFCEAEHFGG